MGYDSIMGGATGGIKIVYAIVLMLILVAVVWWAWYVGAFNWILPSSLDSSNTGNYALPYDQRMRMQQRSASIKDKVSSMADNLKAAVSAAGDKIAGAVGAGAGAGSGAGAGAGSDTEGCLGTLAKNNGRVGACWVNTATGQYSASRPPSNQPGWINRCNYV